MNDHAGFLAQFGKTAYLCAYLAFECTLISEEKYVHNRRRHRREPPRALGYPRRHDPQPLADVMRSERQDEVVERNVARDDALLLMLGSIWLCSRETADREVCMMRGVGREVCVPIYEIKE